MNSVNWNGYEVYPDGRVFGKRGWFLTPQIDHRGYLTVKVRVSDKSKTVKVHYLVATCFVDNPDDLVEVNHKDTDKMNCWYENLEWCTRSYNIQHAYDNELRCAKGVNNARCKVTEQVVREVCELLNQGLSPASIRDKGYDYSLVRNIKRGSNWGHISQEYSFRHQGSETIETAV